MAGSKEDAETVTAFFKDMKLRGLNDPLLVTSDGALGIIKAIGVCFPRAVRKRFCLAYLMMELGRQGAGCLADFKARVGAGGRPGAESRDRARDSRPASWLTTPGAGAWRDLRHGRVRRLYCAPRLAGGRAIRTTNLLDWLFVEERWQLKIIPNAFGERAVLKLMFGALIRAAERWRSLKVTEFKRWQMAAVRKELDRDYEAMVGLSVKPSKD